MVLIYLKPFELYRETKKMTKPRIITCRNNESTTGRAITDEAQKKVQIIN